MKNFNSHTGKENVLTVNFIRQMNTLPWCCTIYPLSHLKLKYSKEGREQASKLNITLHRTSRERENTTKWKEVVSIVGEGEKNTLNTQRRKKSHEVSEVTNVLKVFWCRLK